MKTFRLLFPLSLVLFTSCKVAEIQLDPELKSSSKEMSVSGRHSLKLKRTVQFGEYTLKENKNAWPRIQNFYLVHHFKTSTQRFHFDVENTVGQATEFYGLSSLDRFSLTNFKRIHELLPEIDVWVNDVFTGNIETENGTWELSMFNVNQVTRPKASGVLTQAAAVFHIEEVRQHDAHHDRFETTRYGYSIRSGEEVLATVRLFGKGKIWLKSGLSPQVEHLLATASAALLLHHATDA